MSKSKLLENINHHTERRSFSLHRTVVEPSFTNALYVHYHPEMEFLYMEKGHMTFCSENRRYELHEGDAVFIPPYTVHNAVKGENAPCTYSAVVFSAEWLWGNSTLAHNEYTHSIYANR